MGAHTTHIVRARAGIFGPVKLDVLPWGFYPKGESMKEHSNRDLKQKNLKPIEIMDRCARVAKRGESVSLRTELGVVSQPSPGPEADEAVMW